MRYTKNMADTNQTADTQTAASVDIGTNSVKITIAQRGENGRVRVLHDETRITRLGKSVDAQGRLSSAAMQQTLDALRDFGETARNMGASRIAAVGTSALRDAQNGAEFIPDVQAVLSGTVEIITGDREAELTFLAARRDPDLALSDTLTGTKIATTDSGGGSTEVVIGNADGERVFQKSLQIGAVRVTERAAFSDPPTKGELQTARQIVRDAFTDVPAPSSPLVLVASGGTAANLGAMQWAAENPGAQLTSGSVHGTRLSLVQIEEQIAYLASLGLADRRNVPGLESERADVIIAGAMIQAESLRHFGADAILVSLHGLRYGFLYELLGMG